MGEEQNPDPLAVVVTPLYKILLSRLLKFYKDLNWELVQYELTNNTDKDMRVFIETEIADLSYKSPETIKLPKKSKKILYHSPPTDADKVDELSKNKSVPLYYDVKYVYRDGKERLGQKGHFDVILLARNVIYWTITDPQNNDRRIPLLDYLVEWILPDHQSVQSILKRAISPQKLSLGYHKGQEPKVLICAIYEELQKYVQLTYKNPQSNITLLTIPDNGQIQQRVLLPNESLVNGFANCIDGAVLYASLIEAAELDPIIVFSACKADNTSEFNQGHALIGWRKEKGSQEYEFLEDNDDSESYVRKCPLPGQ